MKLSARCCPSLILSLLVFTSASPAAPPLTYQVIRTSDRSFAANIVLLMGEHKAILKIAV
jgi:hypothetical protein